MKWTLALTALLAVALVATPAVGQKGADLAIGFMEWLNGLIVDINDKCEDAGWGAACSLFVGDTDCRPWGDDSQTCDPNDLPDNTNWPETIGIPGNQINIIFELDQLLGEAIDGIVASKYVNDEDACQVALTKYMCKLTMGMVGAATGCNGNKEQYAKDLPCQEDCVNFMRKCFIGAKEDLIELLDDPKYCFDISGLGISGYDDFCPFQVDAVKDNIVDFLANDDEFCEKLGHEENECSTLNLRATLSDVAAPWPWYWFALIGLAGVAVIAGVGIAVSKKKGADGDKFDDGKSSASEFSQASEATRADF